MPSCALELGQSPRSDSQRNRDWHALLSRESGLQAAKGGLRWVLTRAGLRVCPTVDVKIALMPLKFIAPTQVCVCSRATTAPPRV